jgi:rubrerythrin
LDKNHGYREEVIMVTEQGKTLEALEVAIQMEIDGKEYYHKLSHSSGNQRGRELFASLAVEEDIHRQRFEQIYDAIRSKKVWPKIDIESDRGERLRTIFAKATEEMGSDIKAPVTELDSIQTAMEMENKSYDLYKSRSQKATHNAEREFYEALAAEERVHYSVLLDYYEYLKDPAGWFVRMEHPSLDGG